MSMKKLSNSGITYLGDESVLKEKNKTLVVVGVARGGTSLIAGCLHHLGVFMGDGSKAPVFEDTVLSNAMETHQNDEINEVINRYDDIHGVWGFKRPNVINHLDSMHDKLTNPIYLFIFKDIFAIANRNIISMNADMMNAMKYAYESYGKVLQFIENNQVNGFLFSYEKVMQNKNSFINSLISAIGEESASEEQQQRALSFIEPNPKAYLNASRITRGRGAIDTVEKHKVRGWAKYLNDERVAEVDLFVNGKSVVTTTANKFRGDVKRAKLHSTGNCGYEFLLSDEHSLMSDDKVNVKIVDEVNFLSEVDKKIS